MSRALQSLPALPLLHLTRQPILLQRVGKSASHVPGGWALRRLTVILCVCIVGGLTVISKPAVKSVSIGLRRSCVCILRCESPLRPRTPHAAVIKLRLLRLLLRPHRSPLRSLTRYPKCRVRSIPLTRCLILCQRHFCLGWMPFRLP